MLKALFWTTLGYILLVLIVWLLSWPDLQFHAREIHETIGGLLVATIFGVGMGWPMKYD